MAGIVKTVFGSAFAPPVMPAPPAPVAADTNVQDAAEAERRRQKAAAGRASTDLTGGMLATQDAPTAKKVLLG